jgi:lysozyme
VKTNTAGRDIIKQAESLQLEAYPDPASPLFAACKAQHVSPYDGGYKAVRGWEHVNGAPWTIGYGHTDKYVAPGQVITVEQAEELFSSDLERFERDVEMLTRGRATENQFSALVSFAYNVGSDIDADDICEGLGDSTLLRKFLAGDIAGAADEFPKWCKAGGVKLPGLVSRRAAERALFLTPDGGGNGDHAGV